VVIDVSGVGYKVCVSGRTLQQLPPLGTSCSLFTHLNVAEDKLDLYGFLDHTQLRFFEQLISVSGVGPRSALAILDVAPLPDLVEAISTGRGDLLSRANGIGAKTAERIVLELKNKIVSLGVSAGNSSFLQEQIDVIDALVSLGYRRDQAQSALSQLSPETTDVEQKLKSALKILAQRKQ
jgi:Holliday junction DNA helicase RuvA